MMTMNFSDAELQVLLDALKCWMAEVHHREFALSMTSSLIPGAEERLAAKRTEIEVEKTTRQRQGVLLQAKLIMIHAQQSPLPAQPEAGV